MFGCVVAGRPVVTEFQTISPTQFAFNIPSQPSFSHLVVFLLPGQTLNPGTAAAVHIQIPPSSAFKLLGAVANDKQSAIFRVNLGSNVSTGTASNTVGVDLMVDDASSLPAGGAQSLGGPNIVLGISVEPAQNIRMQLDALKKAPTTEPDFTGRQVVLHQPQQQPVATKILAQRIIANAFNFLSSFAGGSSGSEVVPLKSFQEWWNKFEKRIELDPGFLEREQ